MSVLLLKRFSLLTLAFGLVAILPSCESRSKKCAGECASIADAKSVVASRKVSSGSVTETQYASSHEDDYVEEIVMEETIPATPSGLPRDFMEEKAQEVRKNIVVNANPGDQIIVADDDNVTVKGNGGIVMISGRCIKLKLESNQAEVYCDIANDIEITGNGNSVTLGTVGKGVVSGNGNKLTWESSFEGGVPPEIKTTGEGNTVQQRPM